MLITPHFSFLRGGRTARQIRTTFTELLQGEPALRLLPALLDLPLGADPLPNTAALLGLSGVALSAPPAGGRTLALLQTYARWLDEQRGAPALYVAMPEDDAPNLSPRALLMSLAHRAGLAPRLLDPHRPCLLLFDDYELLPANRRAVWRTFVSGLPQQWPGAHVVLAHAEGEAWPSLTPVTLSAPDDERLIAWLGRLLPGHDAGPILTALSSGALQPLRRSVSDLLLLALTYPLAGMPAARAALYTQAYGLALPILSPPPGPGEGVGRPPIAPLLGRALLRHYKLARGLSGGADLSTLTVLPAFEQAAVAPLAAGLLDDPRPVLDLLWGAAPAVAALRALVACLVERPEQAPDDGIRLLTLLCAPETAPAARALLPDLLPALPVLLRAAASSATIDLLPVVVRTLTELGAPAWTALVALLDDSHAPPALRWAAAAELATGAPAALLLACPAEADGVARAGRAYALALACPAERPQLLEQGLRSGLLDLLASGADAHRRRAVTAALLADQQTPDELRALALADAPTTQPGDSALIVRAAVDTAPEVRRAALAALLRQPAGEGLAQLAQILAAPGHQTVQRDVLAALAAHPAPEAAALLARCVLGSGLDLTLRLIAVGHLAQRGAHGAAILLRLVSLPGLSVTLRAAAVDRLGDLGYAPALVVLRDLLLGAQPMLLRRAAATALGALGRRPGLGDGALAALLAALANTPAQDMLRLTLVASLGQLDSVAIILALGRLFAGDEAERIAAGWRRVAPALADTPAPEWLALNLTPDDRLTLLEVLADGDTPADPPTSLEELAAGQADRLASAAALSLTGLAGRRPSLRGEIAALLHRALGEPRRPALRDGLLDSLAHLSADSGVSELGALLDDAHSGLELRWAALDRLGSAPAAALFVQRRLQADLDPPFLQGKMIELLGHHGDPAALPMLRQIAEQPHGNPQLRRVALAALGHSAEPAAIAALLRCTLDAQTDPDLRAAAAAALPAVLDSAACRLLRELLRADRRSPALLGAVAAALGRAGDHEALAPLLRSAQSEQIAEALAAIGALRALGDATMTPVLVRIAHSAAAVPAVRLAAVSALLRLGGHTYLPLLREYLKHPQLPLRLQAHAELAALDLHDPRLLEPLADPDAPLALRLESLGRLVARAERHPVLVKLLTNEDEELPLRLAAVDALGELQAVDLSALPPTAPPLLRRRSTLAVAAAAAAGATEAHEVLVGWGMADAATSPWAVAALLGLGLHRMPANLFWRELL